MLDQRLRRWPHIDKSEAAKHCRGNRLDGASVHNLIDTKMMNYYCVCFAYALLSALKGGGPRVVVSTAAFHARVRGSVPGLGGLKETKNVSSPSTCESQYCGEPP